MLDHIAVRSDERAHDAPADYASSFRANAACARELARLYEEIAESLGTRGLADAKRSSRSRWCGARRRDASCSSGPSR